MNEHALTGHRWDARVAARTRRRRRAVAGVAFTAVVLATVAPAATASADGKHKAKTATVVAVVDRAPYGEMLATVHGRSLYTSSGPCTGSCLAVWPPLVMPKGTKVPLGTSGLGTEKVHVGKKKVLQVTYLGKALYLFATDTGSSVTGQGVGGFSVATVR